MFTDWVLRVRALFKRAVVEREIDDELQFHIDRQIEVHMKRGVPRAEAIRRARLEFGGREQVGEEYRDALGVRLVEDAWRDLRLASRALRATPIVTTVAVLSLALGIGANTAVFTLIDSLVLRALPVRDPDTLVQVTTTTTRRTAWSTPIWNEFRQRQLLNEPAAWALRKFNLASRGETQFVDGLWVSGSFFKTLGVTALIGRTFSESDDRAGGGADGPVAVISHRFWERQFSASPEVLGRTLTLDGVPFTIIGVSPPAFFGMEVGRTFDVAAPLNLNPGAHGARNGWLTVVGRLGPGQTSDVIATAVRNAQAQIRDATLPADAPGPFRDSYLKEGFELVQLSRGSSRLRTQYEKPLVAIMVAVALVMMVACANIANLLLARANARRGEFSLRLALGGSRWRLARHLIAESVVLVTAGAALGLVIASWGSSALVRELAAQSDTLSTTVFLDLSLHWRILAFTTLAAVVTVVLFGVTPALRASAVSPMESLKERLGGAGTRGTDLSSCLVVVQLALSVILVVAAGLFARSFISLVDRPLGFDPDRVLVVSVNAQRGPVGEISGRLATFERAFEAARGVPGVTDAGASLMTPVSGLDLENRIQVSGARRLGDDERGVFVNHVSPGWFRTMGTRLLAGRDFGTGDNAGAASVAVVNRAFADHFLDGDVPIGHTIQGLVVASPAVAIVGMVEDAVYNSLREPVPPIVYLPFAQSREAAIFGLMSLSIRASAAGSLADVSASVTTALNAATPDLTWTARPLADQINGSITQERITAMLASVFGVLALLLAALGLYGVTAYSVSRRRSEIGVRLALGATERRVVRLILARVALLVALGAAGGTVASLWLSQYVDALLYGLEAKDPQTFVSAALVLTAVGLAAGSLPAIRAARQHPAYVLRES